MGDASPFVIGIDLGTTNCAVAYSALGVPEAETDAVPGVQDFSLAQLVRAGHVDERSTLPSFLYLAGEGEMPQGALSLPWREDAPWAVGTFAREHGAKVPRRLVSSAKSWLGFSGADRRGEILPAGEHDGTRVSPVEAVARYLGHMRDAWNHQLAGDESAQRFEHQPIVLTVPASFDPVARELTVEGARAAGLSDVTLLEEPQAALYAWLNAQSDAWREDLELGDTILVCDIGGGPHSARWRQCGSGPGPCGSATVGRKGHSPRCVAISGALARLSRGQRAAAQQPRPG